MSYGIVEESAPALRPGETLERITFGFLIKGGNGTVVGYHSGGWTVWVGAVVTSNGRIFAPKGTNGKVVGIADPEGQSNDLIMVVFPGDTVPHRMKFKDLEPSVCVGGRLE